MSIGLTAGASVGGAGASTGNAAASAAFPVTIEHKYGETTVDAEPEVLASAALNFEQIAALQPDLIIGVSSGMSEEEYATLSAIAPTIPPSIDDLAGDLFYTSFGDPATPIPAIRVPAGLWGS